MRVIQDTVKDIIPTPEEAREAVEYLDRLLPEHKHCICEGAVGDWRMLPNGETCFYCPPMTLPAKNKRGV